MDNDIVLKECNVLRIRELHLINGVIIRDITAKIENGFLRVMNSSCKLNAFYNLSRVSMMRDVEVVNDADEEKESETE